jgi:hypothetical protein
MDPIGVQKSDSPKSAWEASASDTGRSACATDAAESSVKAALQQLFQKTGVRTRSQLVRIALEEGIGHRK